MGINHPFSQPQGNTVTKVKFTLPVGAYLDGVRHLGNGEFVGYLDEPPTPFAMQQVPHVIEGSTLTQLDPWDPEYELIPFEDPHDAAQTTYRRVAIGYRPDGKNPKRVKRDERGVPVIVDGVYVPQEA